MDIPEPPYSKKLLASSKIIQETIVPKLEIIHSSSTITDEIARIVGNNSTLASTILTKSPLMESFEVQYRDMFKSIPQSVIEIHKGLNLPNPNIANQIASSIPKWDFSSISHIYKSNISDLSKHDFRINVLSQEVEKDLSIIAHEEFTYPNDKVADFYEKIQSDLSIQKKQTNEQTDKLNELKLMIVSMAEKISDLENDPRNNELNKDQSDEPTRKALKKRVKGLVFAFFFVCEFIEHSETAYQLFIWLKNILSGLIHLMNISN